MGAGDSAPAAPEADEEATEPAAESRDDAEEIHSSDSSSWRSDVTTLPWLVDGAVRSELLKKILGDEAAAREAFRDLWMSCRPQDDTASRIRVHEVLLQAARQLNHGTPHRSAQVSQLLGNALRGSSRTIGFEDAFQLTRKALRSLPGVELEPLAELSTPPTQTPLGMISSSSSSSLFASLNPYAGRGRTTVDRPVLGSQRRLEAPGVSQVGSTLLYPPSSPSAEERRVLAEEKRTIKATRSQLESVNARLSADLAAGQAVYQRIVHLAEELRSSLAKGDSQRYKSHPRAEDLEVHLEQCSSRLEELQADAQKQNQDLLALMKDCTGWVIQAGETRRCRDEARNDCEQILQDAEDLERQLMAEQLRVLMLRNAYEEEQPNFGASIDATELALQQKYAQDATGFEREEKAVLQELLAASRQQALGEEQGLTALQTQQAAVREELESTELLIQATQERQAAAAAVSVHQAKVYVLRSSLAGLQVRLAHQTTSNGLPPPSLSVASHSSAGPAVQRELLLAEFRSRLLSEEAALEGAESQLSAKLSQAAALMAMREAAAELVTLQPDHLEEANVSEEVLELQQDLAAVLAREAQAQCWLTEEELALHGCSVLLAE